MRDISLISENVLHCKTVKIYSKRKEMEDVPAVYYWWFRSRKILLWISTYARGGYEASRLAVLWDRAVAVYHADAENSGRNESGKGDSKH